MFVDRDGHFVPVAATPPGRGERAAGFPVEAHGVGGEKRREACATP